MFCFVLFFFLLCKSLKNEGKKVVNIRKTVTNVLSCVQCIAIMVLLGVGLDEKTPCAAILFHDLSSPVSLNAYNTSASYII